MSSSDPSSVALPDSDYDSDASECCSAVFPLLPYHISAHRDAGPAIVMLYKAALDTDDDDTAAEALGRIESINWQIRKSNDANDVDLDLGTIDACIFEHAWSNPESCMYLEDFCRLQYYPVNWARRPPELGTEYRVYESRYWDVLDEWDLASIALQCLWELMKVRIRGQLVTDVECALIEFEADFNSRIDALHRQHGSPESVALFLQSELLIGHYRRMARCVRDKEGMLYEEYRELLRRDCVLYGYPLEWVPEVYEAECI